MSFTERFNLLMDAMGTTNIRLARGLSIDPSLVSRWRTGTRLPSVRGGQIKALAEYFVSNCRTEAQKEMILDLIKNPYTDVGNKEFSAARVAFWLFGDTSDSSAFVHNFVRGINVKERLPYKPNLISDSRLPQGAEVKAEVFYGFEGKRAGILRLLKAIAERRKPCSLLIYSDESVDWLIRDADFYGVWCALMLEIIAKGNRVRIIHNIQRYASELLIAIEWWMPLYSTGSIESYYYPQYRTTVFRRSMFISPDMALTSESLPEYAARAPQLLHTDPVYIAGLEEEFNLYLSMCRPLVRSFSIESYHAFAETFADFEKSNGVTVTYADMLSTMTMPPELFQKYVEINDDNQMKAKEILAVQSARRSAFLSRITSSKHIALLCLPSAKELLTRGEYPKLYDYRAQGELHYTREDYIAHLKNALSLMKQYPNFKVVPVNEEFPKGIYISAKEGVGVIAGKTGAAPLFFAFCHPNLTEAFLGYLSGNFGGAINAGDNTAKLKKYIRELERQ